MYLRQDMFHKIVIYGRPAPEIPLLVYYRYLLLPGGVTIDTIDPGTLAFN